MEKLRWRTLFGITRDFVLLIVFIVAFPLIIALWLPCVLYKKFVLIVVKTFCHDLRQPLNTIGTLFADEDFVKHGSNCSIVSVLKFKGNLKLSHVKLLVAKVIAAPVKSESKKLKYPEMQQYLVNFLGYPFWKQDKAFHIDNHIDMHESRKGLSAETIHKIMLNKPFRENQSPWQITLFKPSQNKQSTFLGIRLHHSMGDGRSVVRLIVEGLGEKVLLAKQASFVECSWQDKVKYYMNLPTGLLRLMLTLTKYRFKISSHPWKQSDCVRHAPFHINFINTVPLEKFKKIASLFGISTSAVILTAVSTAIRKFLRKKGNAHMSDFPIYLTLPKVNHPANLTNHLRTGIPCVEYTDDDCEFLKRCNDTYKTLRNGDHAKHLAVMLGMIVAVPAPLRKFVSSMQIVATGISNIAGDQEGFSLDGNLCEEFTMSAGILQGSIGVSFTVLSYKNEVKICTVAKSDVLSKEDTVTLTALVEKEFLSLGELILA